MRALRKPEGGPPTAPQHWIVYGSVHKDEITAVILPKLNIGLRNKEARRRYSGLSEDQQKVYVDLAKMQHEDAMKKYFDLKRAHEPIPIISIRRLSYEPHFFTFTHQTYTGKHSI